MQRKTVPLVTILIGFVSFGVPATCEGSPEDLAKAAVLNKVYFIRGFCAETSLHFGSDLQPEKCTPTAWTVAKMRVDDVKIAGSDLRISGKRVVVTFGKDGNLENVAGPKGEKVRIDVDLPAGPIDEALISRIKKALFVSSEDELKAAVPSYWDGFFEAEQGKAPPHANPSKR